MRNNANGEANSDINSKQTHKILLITYIQKLKHICYLKFQKF